MSAMQAPDRSPGPPHRERVCVYITSGPRLLVFRHTHFAEAGIQVPGGTVEPGETPAAAAMREASEETGLTGLSISAYLGWRDYDLATFGGMGTERRHYFQLECHSATPPAWLHHEMHPSDGSPAPIEFECFWLKFPNEVPDLAGQMGDFLSCVTISPPDSEPERDA